MCCFYTPSLEKKKNQKYPLNWFNLVLSLSLPEVWYFLREAKTSLVLPKTNKQDIGILYELNHIKCVLLVDPSEKPSKKRLKVKFMIHYFTLYI